MTTGKKLGKAIQRLNLILFGVTESKPYWFDWDYITMVYNEKCGVDGDLDKFAHEYVFGFSLLYDMLDNQEAKEAMYIELRSHILVKLMNNEI